MHLIVNPVSGRGEGLKALQAFEQYLTPLGIPFVVHISTYPGHTVELTQKALQDGAQSIWAMGGDGTIHEVAQALLGSSVPLGIIPCGTGNDLCKALFIPRGDVQAAFLSQNRNTRREIDMWMANQYFFINAAGIGFDAETVQNTLRFKKVKGSLLPYMLGVFTTMATHKHIEVALVLDGVHVQRKLLMLTIANGQYIGGGMFIAPNAKLDDGLLDVLQVAPISTARVPMILPKLLKGTHIDQPYIDFARVRELFVTANREVPMNIDGELITVKDVHIRPASHKLVLFGLRTTT